MTDITFYYLPEIGPDNNTGKPVEVFRPKIPVVLSVNHRLVKASVDCLFDTGSDRNLFPADWGRAAGLKVETKKPIKIGGISGFVTAYTHPVRLNIMGHIIDTEADFSDYVSTPLLGRMGFMDKVDKILIEENKKALTIHFFS